MTNEMSPADYAAIAGNGNGFGNGDSWWIILLFLAMFSGWGNGGNGVQGGSSVKDQYVLSSDFATLQRMIGDGFGATESKLDSVNNGLCSGFYESARIADGTNTNILQSANAVQSQMAQCCCDIREGISGVNYNMAQNTNALQSAIQTGFCQTNFNGQNNTRDIIESQNNNTRAILDALNANKVEALKDRIAEQNQQISALQLASSQAMQNNYLINTLTDKLSPCPKPSYLVCNPNAPLNYSLTYSGCGCN